MREPRIAAFCLLLVGLAVGSIGCRPESKPAHPSEGHGDEISAAGQLFPTGTRVVRWSEPGAYDAYQRHRHFEPDKIGPSRHPDRVVRYDALRGGLPKEVAKRVDKNGWSLKDLQDTVSQVVLHFDACGTSKRCFEVLHDVRGLSCHFLLDLDGTIYQTLDVQERAWHAAQANDLSVGVEIANVGAHGDKSALSKWYVEEEGAVRIKVPEEFGDGGLPPGFVGRPRRSEPIHGTVNGRDLVQYDFTEEQYVALEKLLITLGRVFPKIKGRVPRDAEGQVLDRAFSSDAELFQFQGILAHSHVTTRKVDPGPAFDWERIVKALERAGIE